MNTVHNRLGIFQNKWFTIYFLGATCSKIGSQIYQLAIPLFLFEQTKSVVLMSAMWIIEMIPFVIFGPFLGAMVDRWDRKKVMIISDFGRFVLVALLPLLALFGTIHIWIVFILGFFLSLFTLCFDLVADFEVLPKLVKEEQLTAANSIYIGMDNIARLLGPAIAGFTIALVGAVNAIIIDAISYLVTLLVVIFLPISYGEQQKNDESITFKNILFDVKEGIKFLFHHKILWSLAIIGCLYNLAAGALYTVVTYYLSNDFQLSASVIGNIYTVMGAMALLGSFLAPILTKYMRIGRAITIVCFVSLFGTIMMTSFADWRMTMVGYAILSIGGVMLNIYTFTIRQKEIPNGLIGRINSVYRMILTISFPLSGLILGGLASTFGTKTAFIGTAILMGLVTLFIFISKLPTYEEQGKEACNVS